MKQSVPAVIVTIILLCIGFVVLPLYYVSVIQWRNDMEIAYNEARHLTDMIIDTRQFTESMEEDFNLGIATTNCTFTCTVTREVKVVNPDPTRAGETYTSYVATENNREYKQGDFVTVEVKPIGLSPLQTVSLKLMGIDYWSMPISYTARVR